MSFSTIHMENATSTWQNVSSGAVGAVDSDSHETTNKNNDYRGNDVPTVNTRNRCGWGTHLL